MGVRRGSFRADRRRSVARRPNSRTGESHHARSSPPPAAMGHGPGIRGTRRPPRIGAPSHRLRLVSVMATAGLGDHDLERSFAGQSSVK